MNPTKLSNFTPLSASKGSCYFLNKRKPDTDEYIVDTGIMIDFEGQLQLCQDAIKDLARFIGWQPPEYYEGKVARAEREAELAAAVRDDAVGQFQHLEAQMKAAKKVAAATEKAHAAEVAELRRQIEDKDHELAWLQSQLDEKEDN